MSNYLKYIHNEVSEPTIGSFFKRNKIFFGDNKTTIKDFLLFKDENGESNIDKIYRSYFQIQKNLNRAIYVVLSSGKAENYDSDEVKRLPLNTGTELCIPKNNFNPELVSVAGKNLFLEQTNDFNFLWSEKLFKLVTTDGYVRSNSISLGNALNYNIQLINENIQVWIWVRALNKIINLSAFVLSCNTSKADVGSFNITLNPIKSINRLNLHKDKNIIDFFNIDELGHTNIDFIHQYVQMNDIVFIRFEKLVMEPDDTSQYEIEIGKDKLPGRVWDMIGLVDTNTVRSQTSDTNYEINIGGRDFMKLLQDDASYFLPLYYLASEKSIINFNYNNEDSWFVRNIEGSYGRASNTPSPYEFIAGFRSISDTIGFIVNQLSNLGVTGDVNLFENYGDRRTKAYRISGADDEYLKAKKVNGVWQIVKIFYDKILENRRVVDESLSRVDGTMMDQFNKVCQRPFVEFYGDTYGDEFNIIIRQPPFTKGAIRSFLEGREYHPSMDGLDSVVIGGDEKSKLFEIIDIDLKDLQGYDQLTWDNTYYTAYELQPRNEFYGQYASIMVGGMIPIFYIEEFAKIFGNKKLTITDQYLNIPLPEKSVEDDNNYRSALINDLKYLIDTNFYLPFTRKGSLTLIKGDRRIRKGTFVRVLPTREIFYVDSVSNSASFLSSRVDRNTNIQVSRGMIQDYIFGAFGYDENGKLVESSDEVQTKFSYFDILKTYITKSKVKRRVEPIKPVSNSFYGKKYSIKISPTARIAIENNNPGNLMYAKQNSAKQGEFRYISYNQETGKGTPKYWAKFETPEQGFIEVIRQLELYSNREESNTIEKAISTYAPSNENDTELYINDVCQWLNKPRTTNLNSIDLAEMAKAMVKKESSTIVTEVTSIEEAKTPPPITEGEKVIEIVETNFDYYFDKKQFDFFMSRKQFNLLKYAPRS